MVIREGNVGDAEAIAAIRERTIRTVVAPLGLYTPAQIEAWVSGFDGKRVLQLMNLGTYLVADEAGRVVGFGRLEISSAGVGVIRGIFVDSDCVGRGIGGGVVRALIELGRSRGMRSFELVSTLNARGFYQRLGFRSLGEVCHTTVNGAIIPGYRMERDAEKP